MSFKAPCFFGLPCVPMIFQSCHSFNYGIGYVIRMLYYLEGIFGIVSQVSTATLLWSLGNCVSLMYEL